MTCNTVSNVPQKDSQQSLQDEWTTYTAWPNVISGYANRDILRNCFDSCTTFEQNLCDKENLSTTLTRKIPSNESCRCIITQAGATFHNTCDTDIGKTKLNMLALLKTPPLWNSILDNCHIEKITCWQNSLEYRKFLKSFAISFKEKSNIKKTFTWNLKCYGCHSKKLEKWNLRNSQDELDVLNELKDDSEDELCRSSQCCGQKYYISEHGVVFSNQEEKQIFDEKMSKMDEVLKSELNTIREQHNRLQQIAIKGESEDIIGSMNEEILEADESSSKGDEIEGTEMYDLTFAEEDQERSKPSIFNSFKGLLNNINMPWDISDKHHYSMS